MTYFSAFLLGLVQGVAEFLPISSSGHLAIAQNLLGMKDAGSIPEFFDVLLHLGTLVAVFAAYWQEICEMVVEFFRGAKDIVRGTTPTPVPPARRLIILIVIVTGFLLFGSDMMRKGKKTEKNATWIDALIVGVGQAIATMPGISRSGMTITAGCFTGFERKFAVRFSFLMSIPAILGANILSIGDAVASGIVWAEVPMYLVGVATAAVVGYLCIRLLKMIADKGKFGFFAYYCWAVGLLTLVLNAIL